MRFRWPAGLAGSLLATLRPRCRTLVTRASADTFDAIILGGGHNGLVAANYLARAGQRVAVVERRPTVGGAAVTEELYPGFRYSRASYVYSLFRPHIARDLNLPQHGLKLLRRSPSSFTPVPDVGGRSLTLGGGDVFDVASIAQFSERDALAWTSYNAHVDRYSAFARHLLDSPPPDLERLLNAEAPLSQRIHELTVGAALAAKAATIVGRHLPEFLSFLTSPASRVLDSYFECDLLKATLATDAVIGAMTSCHSPQSAYVLLHHVMTGSWFNVQGGMGTVTQALLAALRPQGGDNAVLTGATVRRLLLEDGPGGSCAAAARVVGVELEGGRVLRAPRIISTVAPTTTLSAQGWLPEAAEVLPSRLNRALAAVDASSGVVKINCAIDRLPQFRCRLPGDDPKLAGLLAPAPPLTFGEVPLSEHAKAAPLHLRGTVHFEANMGQIDAAYRDAAAGRPSQRPIIEMTLPSVLDPSLAPPGKHVCLLFVQYVPYEGWDAAGAREAFADRVFAVIDEFAPGFSASVLHRDVLTPPDLERIFSLPRGNIFQASMGLDQLFWSRPAPGGLGSYRSPIQGLYLGGAGTHPGGGVMGAPGHNATMQLLRDDGWSSAKLRQVSSCPTL